MHIAICDDNIADRKHLERLLKRESDCRLTTTGVLYIDSFGNETPILTAPMQYDLFLISYSNKVYNSENLIEKLRNIGVTAPIVLCYQDSDPISFLETETMFYLSKPVACEKLSEIITTSLAHKSKQRPTIEIREESITHYVFPEDIMYAVESGPSVCVYLANGSVLPMLGKITDMCSLLEQQSSFFITKKEVIVNYQYMTDITRSFIRLKNDYRIRLSFGERKTIIKWLKENNRNLS